MWYSVMWRALLSCDMMWWVVMWYTVMICDVMGSDIVQGCDVMCCDGIWRDGMWCDRMWCDVMCCAVTCCDMMCCDAMWCDNTVQRHDRATASSAQITQTTIKSSHVALTDSRWLVVERYLILSSVDQKEIRSHGSYNSFCNCSIVLITSVPSAAATATALVSISLCLLSAQYVYPILPIYTHANTRTVMPLVLLLLRQSIHPSAYAFRYCSCWDRGGAGVSWCACVQSGLLTLALVLCCCDRRCGEHWLWAGRRPRVTLS